MKLTSIKLKRKNKKGQMTGILIFIGALFMLLFLGFMGAIFVAVVDFGADETIPPLTDLGDTDGWGNMTQIASHTLTPAYNFTQAIGWLVGVLYLLALVGSMGLAFAFRFTGQRWLLVVFFGLMFTLVLSAMIISNIYEDFYDDNGEFADRLKEQTLLSFFILYAPMVFTIIGFAGAIILFTGFEEVVA